MNNSTQYRLITKEIFIGNVGVGGNNPVRIQSMTSTDTLDTDATVKQCMELADAGCEIIRIATPAIIHAENLLSIKEKLKIEGYDIPLIADVHFNPKVAEIAAQIVEKVRINPGNYVDNKLKFSINDKDEQKQLDIIRDKLLPLINICKQYNTAIRIGTNHGSLSQRILYRYGDTPKGMAISAMEFIEICSSLDFDKLILSMKSSNVKIMLESTRLLAKMMRENGNLYPLHLGVTEAGGGKEGRIKSAAGIGALLNEGLGDTIRVSLTGNPVNEIPVAKELVKLFAMNKTNVQKARVSRKDARSCVSTKPSLYAQEIIVIANTNTKELKADILEKEINENNYSEIKNIKEAAEFIPHDNVKGIILNYCQGLTQSQTLTASIKSIIEKLKLTNNFPLILKLSSSEYSPETYEIFASVIFSSLFLDKYINGIWLKHKGIDDEKLLELSFDILQAIRLRITTNEYIACPTCARTLSDIESVLKEVKEKTSAFKGLTIGVMGCIVNGPGEMAGADFGLVGSAKNQFTLYKGKNAVKYNIPQDIAAEELFQLINRNSFNK